MASSAIIATCDYDTARMYRNKVLSTKVGSKKYRVYLRVFGDETNIKDLIEMARFSRNIIMVDYQGSDMSEEYRGITKDLTCGCHVINIFNYGNNITIEDVESLSKEVPNGVTAVINMPDDYTDLRFVWECCNKYPNIRFSGGNLFVIDGVRLGSIGIDIYEKFSIKYSVDAYTGKYGVDVKDLDELELIVTDKPEKSSGSKKEKTGGSKSQSKPKKLLFSSLLNSNSVSL